MRGKQQIRVHMSGLRLSVERFACPIKQTWQGDLPSEVNAWKAADQSSMSGF